MPIFFASLIILAPLYVWRFSLPIAGGLPTNFLMLANFVVIGIGLLMLLRQGFNVERARKVFTDLGRPLLAAILLFALASVISLVTFGVNGEKLAQWMVLYAQPLTLFFLVRYFIPTDEAGRERWLETFRTAAYVVVGAAGLLALVQYFSLQTLPPAWWGNANEPKRAIAFFAHANAFGLFVTPLLAWLIPDVWIHFRNAWQAFWAAPKQGESWLKRYKYITHEKLFTSMWILGVAGMFLSLSRGAWLGFAVAVGVYALMAANKKMILGLVAVGILTAGIVAAVPNLRYRVLLPFYGEKSSVARISLWNTAVKEIKDNPILGKGVNGFSDNWDKYNTDAGLEHYNFPHNIFLNFWVDLGLLGLVSFVLILGLSAARAVKQWRAGRTNFAALGILLFIVAMVAHGLIDIPYLKNDLALIFWIVLALGL